MGSKTLIDWADASWNPVTGCLHGCEYCYARRIAKRFDGHLRPRTKAVVTPNGCIMGVEENLTVLETRYHASPYPYGFKPTFHKYRLTEPQKWKKPKNIFVCSMADLFGDWVPDDCIDQVLAACLAAPQHRYLFLTKNGKRYMELAKEGILVKNENFWYGTTITNVDKPYWWSDEYHTFASVEPILEPFDFKELPPDEPVEAIPEWMIVGAETGNRKGKVIPEKDWMDGILRGREKYGYAVFMKESLRGIMGEDFRQEFPW